MNQRFLALIAATIASAIYGVNHTIAKDLMPLHIKPFGFILLRVSGAALLFWIISVFYKSEKIERKDYWRFLGCAFFGMCINMLAFFKGLSLSTPINSSVIVTMTPVILLVLSVIFLKEKVTWIKVTGIGLGFLGAVVLILFGAQHQDNAPNIPFGNLLLLVNASAYGTYLILVKPLVSKYNTITMMKWFFLIAVIINLPFTVSEFIEVKWTTLPFTVIWKMAFVVVGTTFFTYLLNLYALKTLKTSTLGAFIYLQPVLATLFAVFVGADKLTAIRIFAAFFIFAGVYLSTKTSKVKV
ncbi:MAG: DMT family transporter [Leeuwenhoekiella sp.]